MNEKYGIRNRIAEAKAAFQERRLLDIAGWLVEIDRAENERSALAYLAGLDGQQITALENEMQADKALRDAEIEKGNRDRYAAWEKAEKEREEALFLDSIPVRYRMADISDFDATPFEAEIPALVSGASRLLLGTVGIGKTRLAWALAREWHKTGERTEVVKAQEILSRIKSWQVSGGEDVFAKIRDMYGNKLPHLVIDEIDKIYGSQADFLFLSFLVDIRYEECLQTVVMGNKPASKDVIDLLGSSSFSRLSGDGAVARYVVGKDRRKEGDNTK